MIRSMFFAVVLAAAPALAADETEFLRMGSDVYAEGDIVSVTQPDADDVFAAGGRVEISTPITGSAHLAGRRISVAAPVAGDVYAMGADIDIAAPLDGDANLSGYDLTVSAAIGGDLRAAARHIRIDAPVAGSALLAGQNVRINSDIAGDVVLAAHEFSFGPDARIGGILRIRSDRGDGTSVPESVAPQSRIDATAPSQSRRLPDFRQPDTWLHIGGAILISLLVVSALAALVATMAPQNLERVRDYSAAHPVRAFVAGFLTLSCLTGAAILLVLTLIGVFLAPVALLLAVAAAILGYLVAVYLAGRAIWSRLGQFPPDTFAERFGAALAGAVLLGLVGLIPLVGWIALPLLSLAGLGAVTMMVLEPGLRSTA